MKNLKSSHKRLEVLKLKPRALQYGEYEEFKYLFPYIKKGYEDVENKLKARNKDSIQEK